MSSFDDDDDSEFSQWLSDTPNKPSHPIPVSEPTIVPPTSFSTITDESYGPKPLKAKPIKLDDDGNEIPDDGYRPDWAVHDGRNQYTNNPVADEDRIFSYTNIGFTKSDHIKFRALGGSSWLKETLAKADIERDKAARLKEKDRLIAYRLRNPNVKHGENNRKKKETDE